MQAKVGDRDQSPEAVIWVREAGRWKVAGHRWRMPDGRLRILWSITMPRGSMGRLFWISPWTREDDG